MADPISVGTLVTVGGGIIAYVLREMQKNKKENGLREDVTEMKDDMKTITLDVKKVDVKVERVSTQIEGLKTNCATTIARFEKEISDNRKEILELNKKKER